MVEYRSCPIIGGLQADENRQYNYNYIILYYNIYTYISSQKIIFGGLKIGAADNQSADNRTTSVLCFTPLKRQQIT